MLLAPPPQTFRDSHPQTAFITPSLTEPAQRNREPMHLHPRADYAPTTPIDSRCTLPTYPHPRSLHSHPTSAHRSSTRALPEAASASPHNSYSPYSHFRVGAALLLETRAIVTGCNVENCSYRLTSCAEQGAIAAAVAEHGPSIRLRAVAVANLNNAASMPCGACRQTLPSSATPKPSSSTPAKTALPNNHPRHPPPHRLPPQTSPNPAMPDT